MLKLPIAVDDTGRLAAHAHDSADDIGQSVGLLLATRPGERRSVPDYGLPDAVFAYAGLREAQIRDAVEEWEDRADITAIDDLDAGALEDVTVWTQPRAADDDSLEA